VVDVLTDFVCSGESETLKFMYVKGSELEKNQVVAGEALGVLLNSRGGNQFWRQRAASRAMESVMGIIEEEIVGRTSRGRETRHMKILGAMVAASAFACTLPVEVRENEERRTAEGKAASVANYLTTSEANHKSCWGQDNISLPSC